MNIYGIPRMTADIDLLIDFDKGNMEKFLKVVQSINYKSVLPLPFEKLSDEEERSKLKTEKNLIAFSFYNSASGFLSLDVLLDLPISFKDLWARKEVRKLDDFSVNIVSIDDLIRMKEFSGRSQDKDDIILLSKFRK